MLTVFVIASNQPNADIEKTIKSFSGLTVDYTVVPISSWKEVNHYKAKDQWFIIIWDNEYIDGALREVLPLFFQYRKYEILILYKRETMVDASWRYRLFRKHIYLLDDFRPVGIWPGMEAILDGWVLEHDSS